MPAFLDRQGGKALLRDGRIHAQAKLTDNITKGGSGKWGPVPMPAQAALSDAETKTLAAWVLAGAR